MDAARWELVEELFHETADLPESERAAFLSSRCAGDPSLAAEVLDLLRADARPASLLDRDLAHVAADLMEPGASSPIPSADFGPWRLLSVLGEGGMGVVYLARRADLDSYAALKILRDASLSPARRERFASEQRLLAHLNHPSIARLYDADTLPDGTPWFVMEYVEGRPLAAFCNEHDLSIPERLRLFRSVCEAVQHAHRHAVIHRDLKPSNILVKQDGAVKLLDFGIAKQMEDPGSEADQTKTALRLMTPAYAAPEQLRGDRPGVHTDVYSLGVILYELLSGRLPFDLSNTTPGQAESIILTREPERPSAGRSHAGRAGRSAWVELDVLCLTAMHKDPLRRYRSVEALVRDVDHYLNGEPLEARPDTWSYRIGKFARRNRRALSAAALALGAALALVAYYTIRLTTARNTALAEAARTQRIQKFMMNLFEGGDEAAGPAENLSVATLVDRGVHEARALDGDPAVQAELYQTLGGIQQKLGKLAEAEPLLQASLDRRRLQFGPESAEVAESLVSVALLRSAQASYDEARRLALEAIDIYRRRLPAGHPAMALAMGAYGQILENAGAYDEAIAVLEETVKLQSVPGAAPADLAASLTELANCHFYAGHFDQSEAINTRVLEIDRRIYGPRHPHVADDLINLGAIQFEGGHYTQAESFYRPALEILASFHGTSHQETASAQVMLARALVSQGRDEEAAGLIREAIGTQERVYGKTHPRVASALNELGRIAQRQGRLDEAESCFTRMAAIYREVHDNNHYVIGVALSNLAGVLAQREDFAGAERLFREAIAIYGRTIAADHVNVGIGRARLGRVLARQKRYAEAESESLAGLDILLKQSSPPATWVSFAKEDLVALYEAQGQPERAAEYRTGH